MSEVLAGRREAIRKLAIAGVAMAGGITLAEWYERLSPYGLAEQFRKEYASYLSKLADVQAKLSGTQNQLSQAGASLSDMTSKYNQSQTDLASTKSTLTQTKQSLASAQSQLGQLNQELNEIGQLNADSYSDLSTYEADALAAIAGLQAVIAKYSPYLDGKWLQVEKATVNVLENDQSIQSSLKSQVGTLQSQLNQLTSQYKDLSSHPIIMWESNFKDGTLDGFNAATTDETPGLDCPKYPHNQSDVMAHVVDDSTSPSGYGKALELAANVNGRGGVYVNGITANFNAGFKDDSIWRVYGYVKKASGQIETIGLNMTRTENSIERPAAFGWQLNKFNPLYGWVFLAVPGSGRYPDVKKITYLGDDNNWHRFELEAEYLTSPVVRKYNKLTIDSTAFVLGDSLPSLPSTAPDRIAVFLETTNMYPGCDQALTFTGDSRWSEVGFMRIPI